MYHEPKSSNNFQYSLKKTYYYFTLYTTYFLRQLNPHKNTNFVRVCILFKLLFESCYIVSFIDRNQHTLSSFHLHGFSIDSIVILLSFASTTKTFISILKMSPLFFSIKGKFTNFFKQHIG